MRHFLLLFPVFFSLAASAQESAFDYQLGGRLHLDYNHSKLNGDTDESEWQARRLWLEGSITWNEDWLFKLQQKLGEVGGGDQEDAYIRYLGWGDKAQLTLGKHYEPFGLEAQTSGNNILMLQASAISRTFTAGRQPGISLQGSYNTGFNYGVGLFQDETQDREIALSGRVGQSWSQSAEDLFFVGLGYSQRANETHMLALQSVMVVDSLHLQAEYFDGQKLGAERSGYYLQTGWILTGESRTYRNGILSALSPENDKGAIELVARYENGDGNWTDVELGNSDASGISLGLNWYLNPKLRLAANHSIAERKNSDDDGSETRLRMQILF